MGLPGDRRVAKAGALAGETGEQVQAEPEADKGENWRLRIISGKLASGGVAPSARRSRAKAPGRNTKRAAAPKQAEIAAEAPTIGLSSNGLIANCASAPATAPATFSARNLTAPKRRATGAPKAVSQIPFSSKWVHEPCSSA